jgi:uncharacterized protein YbbC (DUF1343 family)
MVRILFIGWLLLFSVFQLTAQEKSLKLVEYSQVTAGSARFDQYSHLLEGKRVGVLVNHASLVKGRFLVDFLLDHGVKVVRIFSPEHGFSGKNDAGAHVSNSHDEETGLKVISLYGIDHKKPTSDDLKGVDVMLIDLQDVGVRFYTYISTMSLTMEACAENNIPVVVLDRPNPNGFYVDGPVLDTHYRSFVGMHPVPVVYGMTMGEYAKMVNGEGWLKGSLSCDLTVIPMENYDHQMIVKLDVPPSPNLPNWQSVYLYPSLCFFEGTIVSVGRGTEYPFQVYGHPDLPFADFSFLPKSIPGKSANPKLKGQVCYGQYLAFYADNYVNNIRGLNLSWLLSSYKYLSEIHKFFNNYFD